MPRTVTTHTAAAAPVPAAVRPTRSSHVNPVVDLSPQPPAERSTTAAATKPAKKKDAALPIAGGALAFLAIGGAAVAMTRRRGEDEEIQEETVEPVASTPEPVVFEQQPAIVAPSAFAWGSTDDPVPAAADQDDRQPGETWVERAYRGPSADNPSLSLRARLKRAAFFDKREREVAAGVAEPVDADAGLPEAMTEEQERELA